MMKICHIFCFERAERSVDRLGLVRNLGEVASKEGLGTDEIRLFLLLLANCCESGQGTASSSQLAIVFGQGRFGDRIRRAVNRLAGLGLVHCDSFSGCMWDDDFVLSYSIPGVACHESMPGA